jgi:hypothetical protein
LFSGSTIGPRSDLRDNLIDENPELGALRGWQAHHIVPWELKDHTLLRDLGFDANSIDNGVPLPCSGGSCLSIHYGSHPIYDGAMERFLNRIDGMSISDDEKRRLVAEGVEKARQALLSGHPPLRNKDGATPELWDAVFE